MSENSAMAPIRELQKRLNSGHQRFQIEIYIGKNWLPLTIVPRYDFQGNAIEAAIDQRKKFPLIYVRVVDLMWEKAKDLRRTPTIFRSWDPRKTYIPE